MREDTKRKREASKGHATLTLEKRTTTIIITPCPNYQ